MRSTLIFFLISFSILKSQEGNKNTRLDSLKYAESDHVGFAGGESKLKILFIKNYRDYSNDELFFLSFNGSNALRFYSIEEIIRRKDTLKIDKLYQFYLKYPMTIPYTSGCNYGQRLDMSEFILKSIRSERNRNDKLKSKIKLAQEIVDLYVKECTEDKNNENSICTIQFNEIKQTLKELKQEPLSLWTENDIQIRLKKLEIMNQNIDHPINL